VEAEVDSGDESSSDEGKDATMLALRSSSGTIVSHAQDTANDVDSLDPLESRDADDDVQGADGNEHVVMPIFKLWDPASVSPQEPLNP
jgi:hypothetical protein